MLLVVDSGRMSREAVTATIERLDSVGAPLVGAMLNNVEFDRSDSYLPYHHRWSDSDDSSHHDDGPALELPDGVGDDWSAPEQRPVRG